MEKNQTLKTIVYSKKSGLKTYIGCYRFAFNGIENEGEGNSLTPEWRQYDPRKGSWLSSEH